MTITAALVTASLLALLLSAAATGAALVYARRRGLLDQPGKRRSHLQPTPRGGGVGIVAAIVLIGLPAWFLLDPALHATHVAALGMAVLAVAVVGWRDDHAPLPVLPRLAVHALAALLVAVAVLAPWAMRDPRGWFLLIPLAVVLVGFINTHNFMDGIDGILGQQGLFVLSGYGLLAAWMGDTGIAALASVAAAGCLGFLFFNFPPARVFMGDVGSGALGLAIGTMAALVVQRNPAMLWACLILPSSFLVDSGLTLAYRMLGGQRWYAPHRQHLYQWLVRVNWSHARTDVAYMIWNLVVAAPLAWLAACWPMSGPWCFVAVCCASVVVWHAGKRACLASLRQRTVHEPA